MTKAFKVNKKFLIKLLEYFFESIEAKEFYPDIVGYPKNQEYFNSINMMLEEKTNKIIFCDIGLSPHEDTLRKFGKDFYSSENVKTYVEKMKKFKDLLINLK